jgi:UPF0755 protein
MLTPKLTKKETILLILLLAVMVVGLFFMPPKDFPVNTVIRVVKGESLDDTADRLYRRGVISTPGLFKSLARSLGNGQVQAGYYQFEEPLPLLAVINRLRRGTSTLDPVRAVLFEGFTNQRMAEALARLKLPQFKKSEFLALASSSQGYLFPDTYFFPSQLSAADIIDLMQSNFERRTKAVQAGLKYSNRSLDEIIKLASIIEREAADPTDRRTIADILWRRYDAGERLQVDVARETYRQSGLPLQPIANPGLDSIMSTLEPIPNKNWFYLSDLRGNMHYAVTYKEHLKNINTYLR